ncbi:MAG: winged helix-turn-helix domain-containing protein, partial [Anaerolineales bacterium]
MEEFKPAPVMMVKDLETLKILADPLRNQILEILAPEKLTINQMAEKLGLAPSKLYYHINLLEKYGLIQ